MMRVEVHLNSQSQPIEINAVKNTYTKDGLYCVLTEKEVFKFPLCNIFRIKEPS